MKNLIIFARCFWANIFTKIGLVCGLGGFIFLFLNFNILGYFFIIYSFLSLSLPGLGIGSFRAYKRCYVSLIKYRCKNDLKNEKYCFSVGRELAKKDFAKNFSTVEIMIRKIKKFKTPLPKTNDLSF